MNIRNGGVSASTYSRSNHTNASKTPAPNTTDDYERWYTEHTPSNRMLLSLRSGIDEEVGWALDRLWRLATNDQFVLTAIPGLTDALFELPEWYITEGRNFNPETSMLFNASAQEERRLRYAIDSLLILHNSAFVNDYNIPDLTVHPKTIPFIFRAMHAIDPQRTDYDGEFFLLAMELLQAVAPNVSLSNFSHAYTNAMGPIQNLLKTSSDRTEIMAALDALSLVFSVPRNLSFLQANSPGLVAAIKYLPLAFMDVGIVDSCLNFLYTYLSHPPLAKGFLFHQAMPSVLKILVNLMLQQQVEEVVSSDIGPPVRTIPAIPPALRSHELTLDEFNAILPIPEPQRSYEWMKIMFQPNPDGELTQIDLWTLYRDAFTESAELYPVLVAADVIKNVAAVFPDTQPTVIQGPSPRFVIRGVERKQESTELDKFRCLWEREACPVSSFGGPAELYEHLLQHIGEQHAQDHSCMWAQCLHVPPTQISLRAHVRTHLPPSQHKPLHPSQDDALSLSFEQTMAAMKQPTTRIPPPPRGITLSYRVPVSDPPTTSLTALLCIRILFRISFIATDGDEGPKIDADHFGFPGIVSDAAHDHTIEIEDAEQEGERRGRKAFVGVRKMMTHIQIKDEVLMNWIREMLDASQSWDDTV